MLISSNRWTKKQWKELTLNTSECLVLGLQETEILEYKYIFIKKLNICHLECLRWNKLWKLEEKSKILNQRTTEEIFL